MALFPARTIEQWLEDFRALGHRVPGTLRTLERDLEAEEDFDGGLVLIKFELATTETFLERPSRDLPGWRVHFTARDEELVMSAAEVQNLAEELHMVARVASYLEARTAEALAGHE
jgi:hypothetical protein